MVLDVFNTHMELHPYEKDDFPKLEIMYTSIDKFSQKEVPCGYFIDNGKLYLPRGTPISRVEFFTGCEVNRNTKSDPIEKMSDEFAGLYDPRDEIQEESIRFLMENRHQSGLNLRTGAGKTFVVAHTSTALNEKTIIITPNEGLKSQWIKTYSQMFNYRPKHLINIAGSHIMEGLMGDNIDPADVYFVNHQTLRSYMSTHNGYMLHQFFKKIKVGIKVYDESHLEFSNILILDSFSNTNRTWYLTATFDRSDKTESRCFKQAFSSVETYGERESKEATEKHVIYHVVNVNSKISPKDRARIIGFSGMSSHSYGKYAFSGDENQTVYRAIVEILDKMKDVEGKILVFVPLIDAANDVTDKLKKKYSDKRVMVYHSKVSKDEKDTAITKGDIIVSTIKSCGTGRDIPGLRTVICGEPIASKVIAEQMIGRLRPYEKNKSTYFFDICDISIAPINWWFKSRYKKIQQLVKETVYLDLDK